MRRQPLTSPQKRVNDFEIPKLSNLLKSHWKNGPNPWCSNPASPHKVGETFWCLKHFQGQRVEYMLNREKTFEGRVSILNMFNPHNPKKKGNSLRSQYLKLLDGHLWEFTKFTAKFSIQKEIGSSNFFQVLFLIGLIRGDQIFLFYLEAFDFSTPIKSDQIKLNLIKTIVWSDSWRFDQIWSGFSFLVLSCFFKMKSDQIGSRHKIWSKPLLGRIFDGLIRLGQIFIFWSFLDFLKFVYSPLKSSVIWNFQSSMLSETVQNFGLGQQKCP